jgi:hypothetical protein
MAFGQITNIRKYQSKSDTYGHGTQIIRLMNRKSAAIVISIIISIITSGIFFPSCKEKSMDGMIVFTRVAAKVQNRINQDGDSLRYSSPAKIVAIDPSKPGGSLEVLTDDYFSAMSPEISYDGKSFLFAAQRKQNDPWQIYEMNLANRKIRQIVTSVENCIDPAYLPDGRIVFSKSDKNDVLKGVHSLYAFKRDDTELQRITFNPHSYSYSSVLKDGRILTISRQIYPERGDPLFMVLRPDGTKTELFYKGIQGSSLISRAFETATGKLVFIESPKGNASGTNITSINYNRPLHTCVNLTLGIKGDFRSVFPLTSGKLLVSYRPPESERYGLFEFDPNNKTLGKPVYNSNEYDVSEAVVIEKHERPKKLPSEVDLGVKTGLILCQDVNILDPQSERYSSGLRKASAIEVMGLDSSLGIVPVEKDGSFYLKVIADQPLRIRVLDEKGLVLHESCSWIWLRPNERRGCVGCHEDPEQVPENKVPLAVKNPPAKIPVHIIKVKEKEVELE